MEADQISNVGLLVVSTLTGLATEAIKVLLTEHGKTCRANTLAGCVSLVISLAVGAAYIILTDTAVSAQTAVCLIALVFLSWLCAMVGYDKVVQAISQFKAE